MEDNDTAGVVIVNTDNHSKEDGSESGSLTVRLQSRPFDNITINLMVLADNLSHAVELSPSSMNFDNSTDNWSSVQTVIVSSIDDSVDEDSYGNDNQTFFIALDNISSVIAADAKYVNNVSATGKISVSENQTVDNLTVFSLDNDTMGVMVVVVDNNSSENGTRGQMLVSLRSQPYDNVTLSFTIDNGTSATGIATGLLLSLDNQISGDSTSGPNQHILDSICEYHFDLQDSQKLHSKRMLQPVNRYLTLPDSFHRFPSFFPFLPFKDLYLCGK